MVPDWRANLSTAVFGRKKTKFSPQSGGFTANLGLNIKFSHIWTS